MLKKILNKIGRLLAYLFYPIHSLSLISRTIDVIYTGWISIKISHIGDSIIMYKLRDIRGGNRINIGSKTVIGRNSSLTAWEIYLESIFEPSITIGDFCSFGDNLHITAIQKITIGNNVLTGKNVLITDNSHGTTEYDNLCIPPLNRSLYSKGDVIIEDDVWIGNNAIVLPGIRIGRGSVIGANTVVTRNVPPYSIAVGNPIRIIKKN